MGGKAQVMPGVVGLKREEGKAEAWKLFGWSVQGGLRPRIPAFTLNISVSLNSKCS